MTVVAPTLPLERRSPRWIAVPIVIFALIALTVGVFAREAGGPRGPYFDFFFSDTIHMKAWLASAALAAGLFQLFTAAWIYGKLPLHKPRWARCANRKNRQTSNSASRASRVTSRTASRARNNNATDPARIHAEGRAAALPGLLYVARC